MRDRVRIRAALAASVLMSAMLVGLAAGSAYAAVTPCPAPVNNGDGTATVTCGFTGDAQTWTVPTGVTEATFDVQGAQGGNRSTTSGGLGGRAQATLAVSPGTAINVFVGGAGPNANTGVSPGGFNGGGTNVGTLGASGGGASDIRVGGVTLDDRVVIAGGGGGAGLSGAGGSGGGTTGDTGAGGGGGPGGNQDGTTGSGSPGTGENGGGFGGAGGGGFWGGGSAQASGAGGGGGSGLTPDGSGMTNGFRAGNGIVKITYDVVTPCPDAVDNGDGTATVTCSFVGNRQTWTVPAGVTSATFDVQGAQGGSSTTGLGTSPGGLGGRAVATMAVTPGTVIDVFVGGSGGSGVSAEGTPGGFNGGGDNSIPFNPAGSGGGASDVRMGGTALEDRVVIAGGGGGAFPPCAGGGGGGTTGDPGDQGLGCVDSAGQGGNQDGSTGSGMLGAGGSSTEGVRDGGAGGGGYWGGEAGLQFGAGGGGSGKTPDGSGMTNGFRAGDGIVKITYNNDTTDPTVEMTSTAPDPTNTSPIPVTAQFSEAVTGFESGDVSPGNATVDNFDEVDSDTYTFDLTPSGQGLVTADIAAGAAEDAAGNGNTAATQFSRTFDSAAPTVTCSANPANLKSNNHKLVAITTTVGVTDGGSGPNGFTLLSVTSNQPDSGAGSGDVPNDIQGWTTGTADTSGQLRTERYGNDRVYTITYKGFDDAGNSANCQATVTVKK